MQIALLSVVGFSFWKSCLIGSFNERKYLKDKTMHKLIHVDNEQSRGKQEEGKVSDFQFFGRTFFFGEIRSSRVKSITFDESERMVVQTKNTKYIFKEV